MTPEQVRLSRRMSYVLRHNPADIGIELDSGGWADLNLFVQRLSETGDLEVTMKTIGDVVSTNDKQRFEIAGDKIRASQGHSLDIDLELPELRPPEVLWHGTVERFMASIETEGLLPGARTHVHLSESVDTATLVGKRRGKPVILQISAALMHEGGHTFHRSANGVWLTKDVPPGFVKRSGPSAL